MDRAHSRNHYSSHSVFADLDCVERVIEVTAMSSGYSIAWRDPYQGQPVSDDRKAVGQRKARQVNLRAGWWPKGAILIYYNQMAKDLNRTSMLKFVRGPLTCALNERGDIGEFCDRFDRYLQAFDYRLSTPEPREGLIELAAEKREWLRGLLEDVEENFSDLGD